MRGPRTSKNCCKQTRPEKNTHGWMMATFFLIFNFEVWLYNPIILTFAATGVVGDGYFKSRATMNTGDESCG
ncbi:hypothetical protein MPTK2_3g22605 [Marchantia polymorpha subsp. ruderalis]